MQETRIAILASPGMGHLIPLVEFAKRLVRVRNNIHVTCIVPTIGPPTIPIKTILDSLPKTIHHLYLPPVTFSGDSPPPPAAQLSIAISRSTPPLREVLKSLTEKTPLSALIFDLFSCQELEAVQDFMIPPYIFFPGNATTLSLSLYLPKLDRTVSCEYRDMVEPVRVPGCVPFHGRDLFEPVQDRTSENYKWVLELVSRFSFAHGFIVNSFMEMEEGPIKALQESQGVPPVYAVGPVINDGSSGRVDGSECLQWLDDQPRGSVLFVSFGSGGTLSQAQMNELALGLEMSGQKFLWVVRSPNDESGHASYFGDNTQKDPHSFLPKGFLERTKERGLVVPSWAPQPQVLSHESTGGFLTHCGWNSILESVVNGVPLIAWPLFAEQKMNAILFSEHLNVAVRPQVNENDIVTSEEVAKVVKNLMENQEGKIIRDRMNVLQNAAKKALGETGTSTKSLEELVLKWNGHASL